MELLVSGDVSRRDDVEAVVHSISNAFDSMAEKLGIVPGTTRVILADDFASEVEKATREITVPSAAGNAQSFTNERLGGRVAGKTLGHDDSYRDATVLIAAHDIAWNEEMAFAQGVGALAHELAHVIIGRARWACGALEGVQLPSVTGTEFARSISRIASEEYRASIMSNAVIGSMFSASFDGGDVRRMTIHDFLGDSYNQRLVEVLDEVVYPGWPDKVTDYRWGRITLERLGKQIIEDTDQIFAILGHAEAHAEAGAQPRPLDACADHRGVELYLRPAWERLFTPARSAAPLPRTLAEVRSLEDEIVSEGERAVLDLWTTLGITVEERENREWAMWVTDPER